MVGYDLLNSSVLSVSVERANEDAVLTCSGKLEGEEAILVNPFPPPPRMLLDDYFKMKKLINNSKPPWITATFHFDVTHLMTSKVANYHSQVRIKSR